MANSHDQQALAKTGTHPLYADLESRRAFPRIRLRIPLQIALPNGKIVCAQIYNLSPDGIQIRCTPETARQIHPSGKAINDGSGPEITVALRLKHGADIRTHALLCRVYYVLPETPKEIIIGLQFDSLPTAQREIIDALMSASLIPR